MNAVLPSDSDIRRSAAVNPTCPECGNGTKFSQTDGSNGMWFCSDCFFDGCSVSGYVGNAFWWVGRNGIEKQVGI